MKGAEAIVSQSKRNPEISIDFVALLIKIFIWIPVYMFEIVTSSLVLLGLAAYDYRKRRFSSPEDRYMELYGKDEWSSNDMLDVCSL